MSSFDPFSSPRSGRGSWDPFGGPVPRRAGNAPGGDPFADGEPYRRPRTEGRRSPTISFEIPTDPNGRRRDIVQFQLSEDIRQLYDAFSFSIPNPEGAFNYMLGYQQYPITIWESDPEVNEGEDIQQLRGVIVDVSQDTSKAGSVLHVSGYDLGWLLTSCAPYWYNLKGKQWPQLAVELVDKSWLDPYGFRSVTDKNINTRVKGGRADAEAAKLNEEIKTLKRIYAGREELVQALFTNVKALTPKIQIQPGETVGDVLTRYARLDARFVSVSALGDLQFWQPDYKQQPEYVFHWHWEKGDLAAMNNVEQVNYRRDGEPIYNDVSCVGSGIYPVLLPNKDDPNEGKFAGRIGDYVGRNAAGATSTPQFFRRRLSFADSERYTRQRAQTRAEWRFKQGLYDGETWTATVAGHSQNGIPFIAGRRAEIHDTKNGVNKVMLISRVDRSQDIVGGTGTMCRITCKPDGLLGA